MICNYLLCFSDMFHICRFTCAWTYLVSLQFDIAAVEYIEYVSMCTTAYLPSSGIYISPKFYDTNAMLTLAQLVSPAIRPESLYRPHFYQTRSAWSVDQGSNKNHSPAYNFAPTVTKFCVMWEGLSHPHDTKFGNCRCKIVDSRSFPSWSLIHGLRWSGLIKVGPEV